MKNKNSGILLSIALASCGLFAEPGGTHILTGKEKSIEEIVQNDMADFPEHYEGESLKAYVARFKSKNKIGRRKLQPGDALHFPDTSAATRIAKEKAARAERDARLPGRWRLNGTGQIITIIYEYRTDGTYKTEFVEPGVFYGGVWEIKGDTLRTKLLTTNKDDKAALGKWFESDIRTLNENALVFRLSGSEMSFTREK
ncbi:hypothetical protein PDESU_02363 [Pontiella desulfatans]|uniref:Uncharacterized protein n=1 Tax=Pontiella desulfatans TaxID=2750659 RepID=A0A6C2U369_PONDE|nr:hypothetical protein [Pontiella desulfatans]VGO13806.1 hypothetical protein PDESU_02363 [Pontiella desulfatans]